MKKLAGLPYDVNIIGEDKKAVTITEAGHAPLAHKEHYKIALTGSPYYRTAAEVSVDGNVIGNFLVDASSTVQIERPVRVDKLLTFFKAKSKEAKAANLASVSDDNLGVISVKFVPEKKEVYRPPVYRGGLRGGLGMFESRSFDDNTRSLSFSGGGDRTLGAGGTGLSGHSNQNFHSVRFDGDESLAVTMTLRLAFDKARKIGPDAVTPLNDKPQVSAPSNTPVPPTLKR